jgi:hypothetical protein
MKTLEHESPRQHDKESILKTQSPPASEDDGVTLALGDALAAGSKSSGGNGGNSTVAVGRKGSQE